MLIVNVMPAKRFKQVGTGEEKKKTGKVEECSKNTCLEHSIGKQVHWQQVKLS